MAKTENQKKPKFQTSETFFISALLSLSGGLQDAYTYLLRGRVFANAQTGNIVLMSCDFMEGEWYKGLRYFFPVLAFVSGVIVAEMIKRKFKKSRHVHWRQIILVFEALILATVAFMPRSSNLLATMLVSYSCAMQVQAFTKVNGYRFATTMCIGNIRSGTESFSAYMHEKKKENLHKAILYYGVILFFALGAALGGLISHSLGYKSILVSAFLLLAACAMMHKEKM